MAIYVRNEEGLLKPLEIPAINGKDGVTPNIEIGTVTTLEAGQKATVTKRGDRENPILDFGIPKGEKSVYIGDVDSAPLNAEVIFDNSDEGVILEGIAPNIQIGEVTTLESGEKATVTRRGTNMNPIFDFGIPKGAEGTGGNSATVDDTTISSSKTWSSARIEDFVLNNDNAVWLDTNGENLRVNSTKEGYLREIEIFGNTIQNEEDLTDIKHLGELYVNDVGEPILDIFDREQYKIEVVSAFGMNLVNEIDPKYQANADGNRVDIGNGYKFTNTKSNIGTNIKFNMNCDTSKTYTVQMDITENTMKNSPLKFLRHTTTVSSPLVTVNGGVTQRVKFKLKPFANDLLFYLYINPITENEYIKIENIIIFEGDYTNFEYDIKDTVQYRKTILLPCQLMKVGDVADRLYWDNEKGEYVVEKNIYEVNFNDYALKSNLYNELNTHCRQLIGLPYPNVSDKTVLCNKLKSKVTWAEEIDNIYASATAWGMMFMIPKSELSECSSSGCIEWIKSNNIVAYYILQTPQIIETNITEQLKLPTYMNITYVEVTGGIQGNIKIKAPVDGGKVISNLVQENTELKATNEAQDELINVTMLATDTMFMMLEPLLASAISEGGIDPLLNMYVAMVQRGLKTIDQVPVRYREQVREIIG